MVERVGWGGPVRLSHPAVEEAMEHLILAGTIVFGVGIAVLASKFGLQLIVDQIPMKQPKS